MGFEGQIEWDTSKPDGATRKLLDISVFSNFGWKAKTPLEEGLRTAYQWFLSNCNEVKG